MKTLFTYSTFLFCTVLLTVLSFSVQLKAQTPALKFAPGAGNSTENGPTLDNQVITFQNNTRHSSGNTFASHSPTLFASFSLSNQQYSLPVSQISTGKGLNFGTTQSNSSVSAPASAVFAQMNTISTPSNSNFTSSKAATPGTGIDISENRAIGMFLSARALYNINAPTGGRFYFGDLTITFSQTVTDPVLHIVGLGAYCRNLGFTAELELQSPGITLSRLSGSSELTISSGTKILNSASEPNSPTGSGAASGSVLASGSGISALTFKIYMRGDGNDSDWSGSNNHQGDVWLIGVSLNAPVNLSGNVYSDPDGLTDNKVDSTGTVDKEGKNELSETRIIRRGKQNEQTTTILAYPNPVTTELRITIPAAWLGKKVGYEVVSNSGVTMIKNESLNSSHTEAINISKLAPGFYVVKVTCQGEMAQQKIIKQ